jgi:hypothetical protein
MAEPATACAWSDLAACLASGEAVVGVVVGVVLGIPAGLLALSRLVQWIGRRWREFWGPRPARLWGFVADDRPTRAQMLWDWWLRRCWRLLLAVVRRLLLPRG